VIRYKIQKLPGEVIFNYLTAIDQSLIPPLSTRVDIRDYSEKLQCNAIHFCALDNDSLVGIVACYFNEPEGKTGYISSFSVVESHRSKGIAGNLLKSVTDYAINKGFETIILRVFRHNKAAINLYEKFGFYKETQDNLNEFVKMKYVLTSDFRLRTSG